MFQGSNSLHILVLMMSLKIGDRIPDWSLVGPDDGLIHISDFKKPLVLILLRHLA